MICMTVVTDRITIWRVVGALEELRSRDAHEKVNLCVSLLNLEMWCLVFDEPCRLALRRALRVLWRTRESLSHTGKEGAASGPRWIAGMGVERNLNNVPSICAAIHQR